MAVESESHAERPSPITMAAQVAKAKEPRRDLAATDTHESSTKQIRPPSSFQDTLDAVRTAKQDPALARRKSGHNRGHRRTGHGGS